MTATGVSPGTAGIALLLVGALQACASRGTPPGGSPDPPTDSPAAAAEVPPAFANRVWKVAKSSAGDPGTLYVFLGDGTLLVTSAHGTPSLGRWEKHGDSLTVVEESIRYPTDVLAMTADTFSIRMHSPGEPVTLILVPVQSRTGSAALRLWGTSWVLEDLAGAGVMDYVRATLEFPQPGRVAGNGSCNRFFGSATISGSSLTVAPLGSTRKACPEAVVNQEDRYLEALHGATRFAMDGPWLLVYSAGLEKPLRFTAAE